MAEVTQADLQPVAWLYEKNGRRSLQIERQPWNTAPGRDWTETPLYAARHRTEAVKPLVEALENKGALAEAIHNARFNGPITTTWADECESGKLYCHRIANAVELHLLAALRSVQS
ncbi:hypothetical protein S2M10_29700 [Sphingomonas sp. S2M10]|uniref:hypothetical protein n=1 Tax=Sphingomonas sp. S2M10 TaxID=2705010 RepID=UPI0014571789|nr:hypothetical protein [Sphingomonas sp. S2M10]NLS27968.1 hypothetical protein [Sphingomonas sp. S2M10]